MRGNSNGCRLSLKSYIHTPKPKIQGIEPRRERFRVRTLPFNCKERGEIEGFWMCFWEKKKCLEKMLQDPKIHPYPPLVWKRTFWPLYKPKSSQRPKSGRRESAQRPLCGR